jgi:hypothetical protein
MLKIFVARVGWMLAPIIIEEAIGGLKTVARIFKEANEQKRPKKQYVIERVTSEVLGLEPFNVEHPANK